MRLRNIPKISQPMSEETKQKISAKMKGRKVPEDVIARRINTRMQNHVVWTSRETRRKISDSMRGRKLSEETKQKISAALKGRKKSIEARRPQSKATREKIAKTLREYHAKRREARANGDLDIANNIVETRAANTRRKARRKLLGE
jgi:hypothetical protein